MTGTTERATDEARGPRQNGGRPGGHPGDTGQPDQGAQDRSLAEWVSFGVAAAILLAVAGLVVYYWLYVPQGPPVLTVAPAGDVREVGGQFYAPFVVANTGGDTAAQVRVVAELRAGGAVVERGEQTFTYLAGGERQQGAFVFHHDPRAGELTLSIDSYREP